MANREMKYSGVEWIGDIPIHWKLVSVKHLFIIGRGRVIAKTELDDNGDYPVYSSQTKNNGVLGFIDTYDYDVSQLTWTTDGANAGTVFLREGKYNCTNVCGTLLPKISNMSMKYMKYALEYIAIFHKRADTNGFKIMNNEMAVIKTLLPLEKEQQKIATFLDEKVAHIDNIIDDTKKSIENLKAYKQSLITETVTKGLNPNVEMKDSGIDWVGKIPKHWMLRKIKHLTSKIGSGKTPRGGGNIYSNEGILFLRSQNIYETGLYLENATYISPEIDDSMKSTRVYSNDVLLNITGGSIGRACVYPQYIETHANVNQHVCILRPIQGYIHPSYLFYYLISHVGRNYIRYYQTGGNREGLNFEQIGNFAIPSFSIHEQTKIVNYLDEKTSQVDQIVNQQEQLVKEFESYKKSIIYEYVTGKKEVM